MVHGDKDDFAPIEVAERLAKETVTRRPIKFMRTQGANHFLNDGPAEFAANPFWSTQYVGAGPFRLQRWEPGAFMDAAAFDGHIGPAVPAGIDEHDAASRRSQAGPGSADESPGGTRSEPPTPETCREGQP